MQRDSQSTRHLKGRLASSSVVSLNETTLSAGRFGEDASGLSARFLTEESRRTRGIRYGQKNRPTCTLYGRLYFRSAKLFLCKSDGGAGRSREAAWPASNGDRLPGGEVTSAGYGGRGWPGANIAGSAG